MFAYCWRGGVIEFGRRVPKGARPIIEGRGRKVREHVEVCARHAHDGKTLLVPGIPEAPDDEAALFALNAFGAWVRKTFPRTEPKGGALV